MIKEKARQVEDLTGFLDGSSGVLPPLQSYNQVPRLSGTKADFLSVQTRRKPYARGSATP
ncbi:protein of unknown function [Azospirillum baldaniorum]|uniref:Uncharacterized protein n=1 Tax=Azospirillum baldaniorum TaxID=1064539 RepID=A0A9P1NLL2_9PROT|nr:protein of unknown function [Azospirillum baldaniorum]